MGSAAEHALISLLAHNRLRVSEAVGADIEALSLERGHRTLAIVRKGSKKSHRAARPAHLHTRSTWPSASAAKDPSS